METHPLELRRYVVVQEPREGAPERERGPVIVDQADSINHLRERMSATLAATGPQWSTIVIDRGAPGPLARLERVRPDGRLHADAMATMLSLGQWKLVPENVWRGGEAAKAATRAELEARFERGSRRIYQARRGPAQKRPGQAKGDDGATVVTVYDQDAGETPADARPLPYRFEIRNHSPTGFEWGYGGSGPAQLALAILCDHFAVPSFSRGDGLSPAELLNDEDLARLHVATDWYQKFKGLIGRLQADSWDMTSDVVAIALRAFHRMQRAASAAADFDSAKLALDGLARDCEDAAKDGRWTGQSTPTPAPGPVVRASYGPGWPSGTGVLEEAAQLSEAMRDKDAQPRPVSEFADDDDSQDAMLARFAHVYREEDRVRARMDIIFANTGIEVSQGTLGTVRKVHASRVLIVSWDGHPAVCSCSPDAVSPAPAAAEAASGDGDGPRVPTEYQWKCLVEGMRGWMARFDELPADHEAELAELARDIKAMWRTILQASFAQVKP